MTRPLCEACGQPIPEPVPECTCGDSVTMHDIARDGTFTKCLRHGCPCRAFTGTKDTT